MGKPSDKPRLTSVLYNNRVGILKKYILIWDDTKLGGEDYFRQH